MDFAKVGQAVFVSQPKNLDELMNPKDFMLKKYEVVKEVELDNLAWDNFVDDLQIEREFLETPKYQSIYLDVFECILVYTPNIPHGILAVADEDGLIQYAAYCLG